MFNHETVLLNESVDLLNVKANGIYVDATLGGAGHSSLIYSKLNEDGKLILFDQDITAIENAKKIFAENLAQRQFLSLWLATAPHDKPPYLTVTFIWKAAVLKGLWRLR